MAGRHRPLRSASDQELWQMAKFWLASCNVLPAGHKVYETSPTVFDLAHSLRDGVALCQIANCLRPYSVRDINLKPQMSPFLCLKNIRGFLHACVENFGLKESVLFDAHELFDVSDFGKVVITLSHLSKCKDAINAGLQPFPSDKAFNSLSQQFEDEDIYGNLEEIAMTKDIAEENVYDAVTIEDDTKIYDDIVAIRTKLRKSKKAAPDTSASKSDEKRSYVIDELLETEQNYVDALTSIKEKFIDQLVKVLSPEDCKIIFMNIEDLLTMHVEFVGKLERACNTKKEPGCAISNCFIMSKDKFLKYGIYCRKMQGAQIHVDKLCETNSEINKKMLECCQKANDGKFSLRSLLVVPMQRVLKYPLLLRELIKHSKSYNTEKASLEKALHDMQDVAHYINAVKRDDESRSTVDQIQNSLIRDKDDIPLPVLLDWGLLVKDGDIQIKINEERAFKKRYAFLFDRVLLLCKVRGEQYDRKETLHLDHYRVNETASSSGRGKFTFGWKITADSHEAGSDSYEMFTKTEDMKRKWVEDIQRTISNLTLSDYNLGNHRFDLSTFNAPTYCAVCKNLLWGLINQGYLCKGCNHTCHKDCIEKSPVCKATKNSKMDLPCSARPSHYPSLHKQASQPNATSPPLPERPRNKSEPIISTSFITVVAITGFHSPTKGRKNTLMFDAGEEIDVLQRTDPDWWEGKSRKTGKVGFFPSNHVEIVDNKKNTSPKEISEVDLIRKNARKTLSLYSANEHTSNILFPKYDNEARELTKYVRTPDAPLPRVEEHGTAAKEDLTKFKWFAGTMDRNEAKDHLEKCVDGTFLVRESVGSPGQYALSLRHKFDVKHIKIFTANAMYCVTSLKLFPSIASLVDYYRNNTLGVSFPGLDTCLTRGIHESKRETKTGLGYAVVKFDYDARDPREISIKKDKRILIYSKDGDWWRGENSEGQVGYFPSNFVRMPSNGGPAS